MIHTFMRRSTTKSNRAVNLTYDASIVTKTSRACKISSTFVRANTVPYR